MKRLLRLGLAFLAAFPASAQDRFPATYSPERAYTDQQVRDLLTIPEEEVDVGLWALVIAHEYDSSVDVEAYLRQLDQMAAQVRRMLAGRTSDMDKLLAVRAFLYEPGPWNNERPFDYDLSDLTKREFLAQLASVLLHQARAERDWERALSWAEFMLAMHPLSVQAHVNRGAVLEWIVYDEIGGEPPSAEHAPLLAASQAAIEEAIALGWVPEKPEEREAYLQEVAAEREHRAQETRHEN